MADVLETILQRSSATKLTEPAPNRGTARDAAACGGAPDHGRLAPWRFVVLRGEARGKLGDAMAEVTRLKTRTSVRGLDGERPRGLACTGDRRRGRRRYPHPKVPEIERVAAVSAGIENLILSPPMRSASARCGRPAERPTTRWSSARARPGRVRPDPRLRLSRHRRHARRCAAPRSTRSRAGSERRPPMSATPAKRDRSGSAWPVPARSAAISQRASPVPASPSACWREGRSWPRSAPVGCACSSRARDAGRARGKRRSGAARRAGRAGDRAPRRMRWRTLPLARWSGRARSSSWRSTWRAVVVSGCGRRTARRSPARERRPRRRTGARAPPSPGARLRAAHGLVPGRARHRAQEGGAAGHPRPPGLRRRCSAGRARRARRRRGTSCSARAHRRRGLDKLWGNMTMNPIGCADARHLRPDASTTHATQRLTYEVMREAARIGALAIRPRHEPRAALGDHTRKLGRFKSSMSRTRRPGGRHGGGPGRRRPTKSPISVSSTRAVAWHAVRARPPARRRTWPKARR